jgi:hypothetical protein
MRKKLLQLFLFYSTLISAQSYNSPESVTWHQGTNQYFISNNGNNRILARSPQGALTNFTTNISSGPHGLEVVADTLYACDGASIKAFNINNGSLVFALNLGASFLNGICYDGNGHLFATDFTAKTIYRINVYQRTGNLFVSGLVKSPNGIIHDAANNRLVWVTWGSSAPIMQALLSDSSVSQVTATSLGNCDGIVRDGQGNYYVSAWSTSSIYRFTNTFTSPTQVVTGLNSSADIYYNLVTDTLASPNSGSNTVTFHYFGLQTSTEQAPIEILKWNVFPNPATNNIMVSTSVAAQVIIYDVTGKQIFSTQLTAHKNENIGVEKFSAGIYFVKLISGETTETRKLVVTH